MGRMKKKLIIFFTIFLTIASSLPIFAMEMSIVEIKESIQSRISEDTNLDQPDSIGVIPLIFAAQHNDADLTHQLIAFHANVNVQDRCGSTPLHNALRNGNISLAHFLLNHGANADIQDAQGNTPRSLAQEYSLTDILKRFDESKKVEKETSKGKEKEESAKKPAKTKKIGAFKRKAQTAFKVLHVLNTRKNTTEIQRKLLALFTDKKAMMTSSEKKLHLTSEDWYALITAVSENSVEKVANVLSNEDANVNLVTPSGFTALALACKNCSREIVNKLLQHKKTIIDLPLQSGATPLIITASTPIDRPHLQKKYFKIIELLVEHGANIDTQDKEGSTALMKALLNGNIKVAKFLIKLGADTSLKDNHGFSALFYAAGKGYLPIVKKLVKHGANVDATSKKWNPVTQAISEDHYKVAQFLQQAASNTPEDVEETTDDLNENDFILIDTNKSHPKKKISFNIPDEEKEIDENFKALKTNNTGKGKINYFKGLLKRKKWQKQNDLASEFDELDSLQNNLSLQDLQQHTKEKSHRGSSYNDINNIDTLWRRRITLNELKEKIKLREHFVETIEEVKKIVGDGFDFIFDNEIPLDMTKEEYSESKISEVMSAASEFLER